LQALDALRMLGEGCPSTTLAFNMHASVVMPLLESADVSAATKRRIADLVVHQAIGTDTSRRCARGIPLRRRPDPVGSGYAEGWRAYLGRVYDRAVYRRFRQMVGIAAVMRDATARFEELRGLRRQLAAAASPT
jgi:hypothetical protein